ncbi:bacteriochlorophyll/chlorophyll a synthase [Polynucleobacter hirudinilacicola]|jgi:chlorophyll synthase|uniref:Bacteriochlorophyll/chlorophyll a synthase n=1 Tax=Polynucleobacter hirudinilacicola TaxID=1743166 RepID=A0A210RWM2_9BURK|nr:chlorophyll synthase ChlG [Polynucleobacter hirudinilacicola]OWF65408.1 bacteriochlorophyll/chlorophyll a synthase [Polynucleobacter hirudinilacicola]
MNLPEPRAILTLLKPITWFPPMWAFACGSITGTDKIAENLPIFFLGLLLTGPLVCASSQAVNDWYDRHVDAINEPNRPIPSGRIPGRWGLYIAILWSLISLWVGSYLGPIGFLATLLALVLAWFYSMPPMRFKNNGWLGNLACGVSYEGLAWITGATLLSGGVLPSKPSLLLAGLYSASAHGIMTLNDFKAIEGDRQMGVRSLPVQLGAMKAAQVSAAFMLIPQVIVLALLLMWGKPIYAIVIGGLILGQIVLLRDFLKRPVEKALFYSGFGVPILVSGMMVAAFAVNSMGIES